MTKRIRKKSFSIVFFPLLGLLTFFRRRGAATVTPAVCTPTFALCRLRGCYLLERARHAQPSAVQAWQPKERRKNIALACLITPLCAFPCDANQRGKTMSMGAAAAAKPTLSLGTMPVVTKSRCWVSELNCESLDMKRALIALAK